MRQAITEVINPALPLREQPGDQGAQEPRLNAVPD